MVMSEKNRTHGKRPGLIFNINTPPPRNPLNQEIVFKIL